MRPLTATVVANEPLTRIGIGIGGLTRLNLAAPALAAARAGQWLAIAQPYALSTLAHPYPLTVIDARAGYAAIMYDGRDSLAQWLSSRTTAMSIDILGPWGRPLTADRLARHVVVLGEGRRLAGLLALVTQLVADGVAVVVLHGAPAASELLPPVLLPSAAEYHVATLDGSAGTTGPILALLPPLLPWADAIFAALPGRAYVDLRDLVYRHRMRARRGFATVLADAPLACYAAACDGCAVALRDGSHALLCKDGPAFDLLSLA